MSREDAILRAGRRALSVNDRLRNDAIRHSIFLERLKTGQAERIVGFMNRDVYPDLLSRVESRLSNIASRGYTTSVESNRRLAGLRDAVGGIIEGGMARGYARTAEAMADVSATEAEFQLATMSRQLPDVVAKRAAFVMPSSSLLRSLVDTSPMHGHLLKDWFGNLAVTTQSKVMQSLTIGIAQGESVSDLVRRLRGTRANNFTDGVLNESRRNVESIVRTSVNHFTTQAREITFQENEDMVKSVQFVATLDTRTTPICRSNDGKVFPVGEGPRPPLHFNCRSTTVPVLKSWRELGIDLDDMDPAGRASMNGVVPASLTYPEWLAQQSAEVQDEVLGPTRANLYRSGALTIDKFADERGRQLTLAELRQKYDLPVERPARSSRTISTASAATTPARARATTAAASETRTPATRVRPAPAPAPRRRRAPSAPAPSTTPARVRPPAPAIASARSRPTPTVTETRTPSHPPAIGRAPTRPVVGRSTAASLAPDAPTTIDTTTPLKERKVRVLGMFGEFPAEDDLRAALPNGISIEKAAGAVVPDLGVFDGEVTVSPAKVRMQDGTYRRSLTFQAENEQSSITRTVTYTESRGLVVSNDYFKLGEEHKGSGFSMFAEQVANSQKLGVKKFEVLAAGSKNDSNYNGYYTWARFGYDGNIPDRVRPLLVGTTHEKAQRISDLMATEEGRNFWKKYGTSWRGEFDLTPGSYSMRTLEAYKQERLARKQ